MSLRQQKKRKAREDILSAARTLIREQGYEPARMRDIAAAAHVSYQTLYNYFPTKARILQALLLADIEHLVRDVQTLISGYSGDLLATLDALHQLCLGVVEPGERALWQRATVELLQEDPEATGMFNFIELNTLEGLELLMRRAQEFGELDRRAPVRALADIVFCLADYSLLRYLIEQSITKEGALAHLHDQLELVLTPYLTRRSAAEAPR